MSKESIYSIENRRIIFRETFRDEQAVRRNGGTPSDVTFSKGTATFDAASQSYIDYNRRIRLRTNENVSLRIRIKRNDNTNRREFIGDNSTGVSDIEFLGSLAYISIEYEDGSTNSVAITQQTTWDEFIFTWSSNTLVAYQNGVNASVTGTGTDDLIFDRIGWSNGIGREFDGEIELVEIYNITLSTNEVKNLYEGKRFRPIGNHAEQLGPELLSDNGFDSACGVTWTCGDDWTIAGGVASHDTSTFKYISQAMSIESGVLYQITYEVVTYTSGTLILSSGSFGTTITLTTTVGTHTVYVRSTINAGNFLIGSGSFAWVGSLDNVYCKKVVVEETTKILNVSAQSGSIIDRWGNTLTPTNVEVFKDGEVRAMLFNGSDSKADCGGEIVGAGDVTIYTWVKPYSWGENNQARVIDNSKMIIGAYGASEYIIVSSDGSTAAYTNAYTIALNKWNFVCVTRTSAGVATIYINGANETSASASGTPAVGTTNLTIGNKSDGSRAFDGLIEPVRVIDGILTVEEISQLFSAERIKYQV